MRIKKDSWLVPVIFGCFMMLSYVGMRLVFGGNYEFLHIISARVSFPPMWVFNALNMLTLFFFGVSAGFFITEIFRCRYSVQSENLFFKGAVFYVAVYFLSLLWYPLLFSLQLPLVSLVISVICLISLIVTLVFWVRVTPPFSLFLIPIIVWQAYLSILNLTIVFGI